MFTLAFDPQEETTREISGGLLWIVFAFAGTLLLNRSFPRELGNDCLDALIAAAAAGAALFLGKALANYLLVMAVELIALPLFGVFYNVRWTSQFWQLMLVIALGTWGMTVTGTIFSALTVNIRDLIALPLFGVFYNVRWTSQFWQLMLVIALGTWGMTVTGTIFSALTVNI